MGYNDKLRLFFHVYLPHIQAHHTTSLSRSHLFPRSFVQSQPLSSHPSSSFRGVPMLDQINFVECLLITVANVWQEQLIDRKSTRLNSSHVAISYAVFCLKKKNEEHNDHAKQIR